GVEVKWEKVQGEKGERVRLPRYEFQRLPFWLEAPEREQEPSVILEDDLNESSDLRNVVERIVRRWPVDGAQAVNRKQLAPFIFLGSARRSLFYFDRSGESITTLIYAGPRQDYEASVKEIRRYAKREGLQLNLLAEEPEAAALRSLGFTTTPFGAIQSITDLTAFNLKGNRMRRLRYQVSRYERLGNCATTEYRPGADPAIDEKIVSLIDEWVGNKGKDVSFAPLLKRQVLDATLDKRYRLFITGRGGALDSVVILSPAGANNGYLMDLEFYRADSPSGCLEHAIVKIIETLRDEGHTYLSLGGSYGTQLNRHANADPNVVDMFSTLHDAGVLNGDSNFQFKNKFRPQVSTLYLCRQQASDPANLPDLLMMFANKPGREQRPINAEEESGSNAALHPLIGRRLCLPLREILFESRFNAATLDFMKDHRVFGTAVLPGSAYLEMGLAAAVNLFGAGRYILKDVSIRKPMFLAEHETCNVQLVLRPEGERQYSFEAHRLEGGKKEDASNWTLHAVGMLLADEHAASGGVRGSLDDLKASYEEEISGEAYYGWLAARGYDYGKDFQAIEKLWRKGSKALGLIQLPRRLMMESGRYNLHPALLDACFQLFAATMPGGSGGPYLMMGLDSLRFYHQPKARLWSEVAIRNANEEGDGLVTGDLRLFDDSGEVIAEIEGLHAR
ncbi:MAG TPA: polyketide synthase dehydratase domain-containing protein, partial [Blastocatellia bacterium]